MGLAIQNNYMDNELRSTFMNTQAGSHAEKKVEKRGYLQKNGTSQGIASAFESYQIKGKDQDSKQGDVFKTSEDAESFEDNLVKYSQPTSSLITSSENNDQMPDQMS
mmetsp:Transcript_28522/g.35246  ORF Transcript_28522/g.35246 Transcript_28522/m.35246 type:complete len:107 (+) Transcript_28522:375-695(+)